MCKLHMYICANYRKTPCFSAIHSLTITFPHVVISTYRREQRNMFALFRYKGLHKNPPWHSEVSKRQKEASAEGMLCSQPPETSMDNRKKSNKAMKSLTVLRRAGHKHSLCSHSRAAELPVSWMPLLTFCIRSTGLGVSAPWL